MQRRRRLQEPGRAEERQRGGHTRLLLGHIRREFYDLAKTETAPIAGEAMRRIAALNAIEGTIRGQPPELWCATHQARSRPLVETLFAWLEQQLARPPSGSPTAQAIHDALNHHRRVQEPTAGPAARALGRHLETA